MPDDPRRQLFEIIRPHLKAGWPSQLILEVTAELDKLGAAKAPVEPAGGVVAAAGSTAAPEAVSGAGGRRTGPAGINLIHSFETCKLAAYPDPGSRDGNPWTIGWGSTGPGIARGVTWTQAQADERFKSDLAKFEKGVSDAIGNAPTTQSQFDALVSLFYNIGISAGSGSTVIRRHKAGEHEGAATAFGMWVKNDGKVMNGLVRRRAAEAALYRGQA